MKKIFLVGMAMMTVLLPVHPNAVYVDSSSGKDANPGTKDAPFYSIAKAVDCIRQAGNATYVMKINPGIYVLNEAVRITTEKPMAGKRILIEASVLPGDAAWTPEKMPVLLSVSRKGELAEDFHFVAGLLIDESQVTVRGLKFLGYAYPNARYFPIARFNLSKRDLRVEQCLFIGHEDASHLQVGIMAHGDSVMVDHCVFYQVRNGVVFWMSRDGKSKTGNGITNSIIYGSTQSGLWTASTDADFVFKNNIVANCKHFWIKNRHNTTVYTVENCYISNNTHAMAIPVDDDHMDTSGFEIKEVAVAKEGVLQLKMKAEKVHEDLPIDYLHPIPGSPGAELGAGLFHHERLD